MIPKIIHYCWFGRNPKPALAEKCLASWKKHCPDYEIREWNEDNYDLAAAPLYVRQAYEAKKWAFVTDYVRLQVVYECGGIYLDTDVELKKNLDSLLGYSAYFGFEDGKWIATGLGFGAEQGTPILQELMDDYRDIPFLLEDGSYDKMPCPLRNTEVFLRHGLQTDDSWQVLQGNVLILPSVYLCPIDSETMLRTRSDKTISIHWFDASWMTREERAQYEKSARRERIDRPIYLMKLKLKKLLGDDFYNRIKKLAGRGTEDAEG